MSNSSKSAKDEILAYINSNPLEWHPTGTLQLIPFRNHDGTRATGKTISRRLQNLEEAKEIAVGYDGVNAKYHHLPPEWRYRYIRTTDRARKHSNTYWRDHALAEERVMPTRNLQLSETKV